jgi:hypothetical protein
MTKPSGVVFFEGYVNEAINEHEPGLHQWNFMPIDTGDLVIWQRRGNVVSLRGGLAQKAIVTASGQRVVQGVRSDQLRGFHHREPDLRTQRNDRIVAFLFVFSSGEVAGA